MVSRIEKKSLFDVKRGRFIMVDFKEEDYKIFQLFDKDWALVTAGSMDSYNSCTLSWGALGSIWNGPGKAHPAATIYVHPARYTSEFLKNNEFFTLSFYAPEYKKALAYMGSHSGRNEDKAKGAGLTPIAFGNGVTYEEAKVTFLCRKLYMHQFSREDLAKDIQDYYAAVPQTYPDFNGGWQPHYQIIGDIIDIKR